MTADLLDRTIGGVTALLRPRSIALVGASPRPGSLAERPLANLRRHGFAGRILPVNPRYEEVGGLRCYPDLAAIGEAPDVVMVLTGIDQVFATLDQAVAVGARCAMLFAGGFAETGAAGAAMQDRLTGYAERGLRIFGPNSNGLFNVSGGVAMGFSAGFELPVRTGGVALLSQSGAIATGLSSRASELGVGFSHIVATGNEADLEVSDFIEALIRDDAVSCFALYVEALKNPARFLDLAERALAAGKPIILFNVGRSAAGQQVALSHTGAMAGSHAVLAGALAQRGVRIAESLDDLIGLAMLFDTGRRSRGGGLAVASLSGGMAAIIADQCDEARLPLASFGETTSAALGQALPAYASIANPLDVTGQAVSSPPVWTACLNALSADPAVGAVLSVLSITANLTETRFAADIIAARGTALQACLWTSGSPEGAGFGLLRDAGVPLFLRAEDAVRAIGAWQAYWATRSDRLVALALAKAAARALVSASGPTPTGWALLAEAAVPVARQVLVANRAGLEAAIAGFRFPVVAKIESAAIPHKSELGLVRLGLRSPAEVADTVDAMMATLAARLPDTPVDGVLVQEMIGGKRELILGMRHEPGLPPAIVLGIGGIFSEVIADVAIRLAPLSAFDVREMIDALRLRDLFGEVRGLGAVDREALTGLVVRFSDLALRHRDGIAEMEINPLILSDDGRSLTAVDVLVGGRMEDIS